MGRFTPSIVSLSGVASIITQSFSSMYTVIFVPFTPSSDRRLHNVVRSISTLPAPSTTRIEVPLCGSTLLNSYAYLRLVYWFIVAPWCRRFINYFVGETGLRGEAAAMLASSLCATFTWPRVLTVEALRASVSGCVVNLGRS